MSTIEPGLRLRSGEVSALLRSDAAHFVVVTSPRAEAVAESTHLVEALRDRRFNFAGIVVNLIHPMPIALQPDDAAVLDELADGPLADHVAWHEELTQLATRERDELDGLVDLADDRTLVELPLLDVDVHDLDGLAVLADRLAGR